MRATSRTAWGFTRMNVRRGACRSLRGAALVGAALAASAPNAAAQAPDPGASVALREEVLAVGPVVKERDGFRAFHSLAAGEDYVGWIQRSLRTRRERAVSYRSGRMAHGPWLRGQLSIALERRTDSVSGRTVTRFVLTRTAAGGGVTRSFLSPKTLRPTSARWDQPDPLTAVDGERTFAVSTEPGSGPAVKPSLGPEFVPTQCRITGPVGTPPIASIDDCSARALSVHGALLTMAYSTPSQPVGDTDSAGSVALYDLNRPALGWRLLGTIYGGKGGSTGIQGQCVLDDGVAILRGSKDFYGPDDPATWSISLIHADPAIPNWSAPTPQLVNSRYGFTGIACGTSSIYASYPRVTDFGGGKIRIQQRIVRLLPR